MMKLSILNVFFGLMAVAGSVTAQKAKSSPTQYYQIKIYHFKTASQETRLDQYFKDAYLPAMHQAGIKLVGVFKPVGEDTLTDKRVYVFIPLLSLTQFETLDQTLLKNQAYLYAGKDYLDAAYNEAPYTRMESILLSSFTGTQFTLPQLITPKTEHLYELRSYESPTEKYHESKFDMFTRGNEVGIFKRLNFNPVFYAHVISGSHMPNLMYLTTFNNKADRDKHWDEFGKDADWNKLKALPQYQNNISHADTFFMNPVAYSDF